MGHHSLVSCYVDINHRKFPQAQVIGNDISAIQPKWVAPNVEFIVEDFESEWLYQQNSFDFVHARLLAG
jgi:hypothetical protein